MPQKNANDVAKLRIRKEKDFNITEFFRKASCFYEISLAVSSEIIIFAKKKDYEHRIC